MKIENRINPLTGQTEQVMVTPVIKPQPLANESAPKGVFDESTKMKAEAIYGNPEDRQIAVSGVKEEVINYNNGKI